MAKTFKSQWEFGELFAPASVRRVFTVTELTGTVRRLLEGQVGQVWVTGEITNLREQSSGHIYFALKDTAAQLQCVCFRNEARGTRHLLQDGQKVVLQGDLTVYEARGQYQLIVRAVEAQGVGALQLAFEKLKQRLNAEGLFAPERKRPLPRLAQRIGLVTSPTGAALRDVLHVAHRRFPGLEVVLAPCRVQGQGAAEEIVAALQLLNEWAAGGERLDLILVTRGGGSLEDLWAFNEEIVARAIAASAIPVVSAIGHEIDFTIADFVADLRAATPSAAAELITEGMFASQAAVAQCVVDLRSLARRGLAEAEQRWRQAGQRLERLHPRRQLNEARQHLDELETALVQAARQTLRLRRTVWEAQAARLTRIRPGQELQRRHEVLELASRRLAEAASRNLDARRERQARASLRLDLLSPLNVLRRGYSITSDAATGEVLRDPRQTQAGRSLRTRLHGGDLLSVVQSTNAPTEPPA
jgi:exodeoxyribonuclease VII large subunit